jgi:tetratricopeptide (TPR) repeat protein
MRSPRWIGLLALGALLAGWGSWRLSLRGHPAAPDTAVAAALDPEERELREAVSRAPADLGAHLALGRYLLGRRRPYEAMWAFQDALDLQPGDAEARRGLARALIVARLPRRALEALADRTDDSRPTTNDQRPTTNDQRPTSEAGSREPGAGSQKRERSDLEDRRVAAAAYLTMGDPLSAVTMLEVAGPALRHSTAALLDLGNAYEALGDDAAAGTAYRQLLQLQPSTLEGNLALARVAARGKRWDEVFVTLARARKLAPDDPRPSYRWALALQTGRRGDGATGRRGEGATEILQRILLRHPEFGPAHLQLGLWHLHRGSPADAVRSLERAVALRAGGEETRLHLAAALEATGQKAEAAFQRGRYYEGTQQPHRAVQEYRRLAALDPQRKDVPLLLSAVYSQLDQNDPAVEAARMGFERYPQDLEIRTRYAMLLMMTDRHAEAGELCSRWITELPNWAEPYRLRGRMEREALRADEAVRFAEKAMALEPQNPEYCLEAARAQLALLTPEHVRHAAETLRRGIALDPHNAEMHLRLGEVLERLGDLDGARLHYLRSMDCERNVRFGAYALSQLCPRLKKAGRTRFYAENVRVLREREDHGKTLWRQVYANPGDAGAHTRLAELLQESGDLGQALSQLEQAVRLRPESRQERQIPILRRLQEMRSGS